MMIPFILKSFFVYGKKILDSYLQNIKKIKYDKDLKLSYHIQKTFEGKSNHHVVRCSNRHR